jgi:hypothetical protein
MTEAAPLSSSKQQKGDRIRTDQIEILTDHGPGGPVDEQISDSSGQSSTTIDVGTPINAQS